MQHNDVERGFEDWSLDQLNASLDNIYINALRPFSRASWEAELSINQMPIPNITYWVCSLCEETHCYTILTFLFSWCRLFHSENLSKLPLYSSILVDPHLYILSSTYSNTTSRFFFMKRRLYAFFFTRECEHRTDVSWRRRILIVLIHGHCLTELFPPIVFEFPTAPQPLNHPLWLGPGEKVRPGFFTRFKHSCFKHNWGTLLTQMMYCKFILELNADTTLRTFSAELAMVLGFLATFAVEIVNIDDRVSLKKSRSSGAPHIDPQYPSW